MALTQADFQQLSSTGGAQAVFDAAKNAGMSLEQLAQVGGVSTQEMANLAQSQGISTEQLGQIGWSSPAPAAPTPPAAGTPAIAGKTGQMDVLTGQFKYYGTPEYDSWLKGITPELNAYGITPQEYLKGGVGARMMNNPLVAQYSSDFAANNTGLGGGQAWAGAQGGLLGYAKSRGYTDAQGYNTGLGDELGGGISPQFRAYRDGMLKSPTGNTPTSNIPQQPTPYRPPQGYQQQPSQGPINQQSRMGNIGYGGYGGGGYGGRQSMYPYQNYGRQGSFGGTATSRMPYTGYQPYQPYGGGRSTGMFGAPTMNYNMRNRPMQTSMNSQYNPNSFSQNNPYSQPRGYQGGMGGMNYEGGSINGGWGGIDLNSPYFQNYRSQYPNISSNGDYSNLQAASLMDARIGPDGQAYGRDANNGWSNYPFGGY